MYLGPREKSIQIYLYLTRRITLAVITFAKGVRTSSYFTLLVINLWVANIHWYMLVFFVEEKRNEIAVGAYFLAYLRASQGSLSLKYYKITILTTGATYWRHAGRCQ